MAFLSMGPLSSSPISAIPGARVPQNLTLNLADTAGATDGISYVGGSAFALNDPVSVTDDFTRVVTYNRTFPDSAMPLDALTKAFARARTLADSASAVDALTKVVSRNLALNDLVSATDALSKTRQYGLVLSDFVTTVDELGKQRGIYLDDTAGTLDDLDIHPLKNFTEFVVAVDAISLNLTRTGIDMTAEPDVSYVASVATSHLYRLDAAASSHLFIDSVEEYSLEETRSPAHATE